MSLHLNRAPQQGTSPRAATGGWRGSVDPRRAAMAIPCLALAAAAGLMLAGAPARAAQRNMEGNHLPFAPQSAFTGPGGQIELRAACPPATHPGETACFAVARQDTRSGAPQHAGSRHNQAAAPFTVAGYGPSSLRSAYHLPSGRGHGRVVAIVDAYDDPKAESNLAHYRRNFGLPACTAKNGCFRKVNQRGGRSYPRANAGWAAEISLDLDMVSATCPKCHILLVEASSAYLSDLGKAVNTAVRLGARYVSNSYGAPESSSDTSYDSQYYNHTGVAITASAGDDGYGSAYPADSRYVTAVGGTSLRRSSSARGWSEKAWHGTGSGCSAYDAKPSWQGRTGCGRRAGNDVAAVADPNTGVAVYDTFRSNGWQVYGGTSAAAPIIAAAYALAGKPRPGTYPASYAYTHRAALHDVTSGRNGSCGGSRLCRARAGYDGPTGLGTPNGVAAFRAH